MDIKSLVVVAIRNSLIEDMKSTIYAAKKLGLSKQILDDSTIKIITYDAIKYFSENELNEISINFSSLEETSDDPYLHLKESYPIAWEAMKNLSQCTNYMQYPTLEYAQPKSIVTINPNEKSRTMTEVQSGIDPRIDNLLQQILNSVISGRQPFFYCDCFKMISRNPDKLFKVIDIVLSSSAPVVTTNYYISNGYVAKRSKLLRPAHDEDEILVKLKDTSGLRKSHLEILKIMKTSMDS
ncbi:hypothetical protein COLU111180_13675 [Cohnella lubricantis]|uniref:Uncharacterized protein n=1 Tax=Cohnella lubricantis TaxID=2163172 RepID=A0A841TCR8_9BACL|nr:hypothetical protein [Cohnella lubricantis]MBB6677799.1 hypothetical protein [Cohnella lubricantis]MBP2120484.1 hypothetical protein [Cohnella lubricantis]